MNHPKAHAWDRSVKALFDELDAVLENRYAGRWKLRRNRPARGKTSNPEADGLFNVGVFFTPGYGSRLGRGYLVEIIVATEETVSQDDRLELEDFVKAELERLLPRHFPGRALSVDRDGTMLKIHGDLSLGMA
ncbi:MAG: hypothetical protein JW923_02615 [Spirochaetales bacterium]|nr:hypothetical protein [Spirochaetales bacterium]